MINLLLALLTIFFIVLTGILPFRAMYFFSDLMYFLLYKIIGYRKVVIVNNLKLVFQGMSEEDTQHLLRKVYKNLTDIIIEGIKSFTMGRRQILKRHRIVNPEIINQFWSQKKSLIVVTSHYCNWEWGSLSASLQTDYNVVAFYKPLGNPWVDKFLRWSRTRYGTALVPIYETSAAFEKFREMPTIFLMAADQSPSKREQSKAYWIDFLGIRTAFLHGPEKHAKLNGYDIVYVDIQRERRGYYSLNLSVLAENADQQPEGEITKQYAKKLESIILENPANWLWSHRRWKLGEEKV
jgi:KDO2-lipid IV(A) lauroyltransferase